jgi:hypothetical protein
MPALEGIVALRHLVNRAWVNERPLFYRNGIPAGGTFMFFLSRIAGHLLGTLVKVEAICCPIGFGCTGMSVIRIVSGGLFSTWRNMNMWGQQGFSCTFIRS